MLIPPEADGEGEEEKPGRGLASVAIWLCADGYDDYIQSMSDVHCSSSVDDSLLESAARCLDSQSIAALGRLQLDERAKARLDYLAQSANEGRLTSEESNEYERFIELDDIIATLRLKAERQARPAGAQ